MYQTMKALTSPHIPNLLIRRIFELKAFCINGEGPQVFQCVRCQKKDGQMVFSAREGGLVCTDCARNISDGISLDNSTLYTMQYIEISTIEKLYTFTVSREVLEKLSGIMERYCLLYVEKGSSPWRFLRHWCSKSSENGRESRNGLKNGMKPL